MDINEMILNHGAGCFYKLVESFSDEDIEKMNYKCKRENYSSDFDYKYAVAYTYVRDWLMDYIECGFTDSETRALFEVYCSM